MLTAATFLPSAPAVALDSVQLVAPGVGARITEPVTIRVRVDASDGEVIESANALLRGPTNRSIDLAPEGPPDADGVSFWTARLDPLDAEVVLANGPYRLLARANPVGGEASALSGHDVVVEAFPPKVELDARPSEDDATMVVLRWDAVDLPDFLRYRIERRDHSASGEWRRIFQITDQDEVAFQDAVPEPGEYRYRVIVVRRGADAEREVLTSSDARGVRADPGNPGTFPVPPEPQPRATGTPQPDGDGDEVAQPDPGPPETSTATTPDPGAGRPVPTIVVPAPVAPPPGPTAPSVVPLDDGVFEGELPFTETETELALEETETAFRPGTVREGGTLAVLTEEPPSRNVYTGAATGLLLLVIAGHVRRFMSGGRR